MHAQVANVVTCAGTECVQPGTESMQLGEVDGTPIVLEFCSLCAARRVWDAESDWQPVSVDSSGLSGETEAPYDQDAEGPDEPGLEPA